MNEVNRKNDEQIFAQGKQGFRKMVKFVWATSAPTRKIQNSAPFLNSLQYVEIGNSTFLQRFCNFLFINDTFYT